jgi:hypothetical protein
MYWLPIPARNVDDFGWHTGEDGKHHFTCFVVDQEWCNEDALHKAAKRLGFTLVPLDQDEPTPKRAKPAETSTTGRKRTCSGTLPLSLLSTPHARVAMDLEEPMVYIPQGRAGGDAVRTASTPYSSKSCDLVSPAPGLTPSPDQGPIVVEKDAPEVVVPALSSAAAVMDVDPVPSASAQEPPTPHAEPTTIKCMLLDLAQGLNRVNNTMSTFAVKFTNIERHSKQGSNF